MRLLLVVPPKSNSALCEPSLYTKLKRFLLLSELECQLSLHLVQAWLLMATFEMGHGLESAAYLSIGTCARTAMLLGIHQVQHNQRKDHADWVALEEQARVWWGIVILERCVNLSLLQFPSPGSTIVSVYQCKY